MKEPLSNLWRSSLRVGLLGSGQLAQMLAASVRAWGLPIKFLAGSFDDPKALEALLADSDCVVFENEFVDCAVLKDVAKKFPAVSIVPDPDCMEYVRDKSNQKRFFEKHGIATAKFLLFDAKRSVPEWLKQVTETFPEGAILKWGRLGYDGKGVFLFHSGDEKEAVAFIQPALDKKISVFAEAKVNFRRELAIVACYSTTKELATYPLVVSEQKDGICWNVYGPAVDFGVSKNLQETAKKFIAQIAKHLPLYGTFALEFFETEKGELLVNELAPRVHNSGHYTQNACKTSQFENHWRAVLGLPLGETKTTKAFAMANLLGPNDVRLKGPVPLPVPSSVAHTHWYGKEGVTPKEKLDTLMQHPTNETHANY